ncbi:alcohol dehydrogenase family protein [Hyphomonas sp. FCG-A18]|uniref:alcohol dehydrogenase family protein n=1 Tax=Hyphomonas sp. FCG-A18 TaxID=3080019 RepID=UPI002B2FBE03|nr:alcohol dehydrogenase family protein [Hyphomonas sp. FCG-A18]
MKGLIYHGPKDIRYDTAPEPQPENTRSAIIKVSACGICGSDLHIYEGHGFSDTPGYCVGHEAVGEVVEAGSGVTRFKSGDKVMISAAVGCGQCRTCLAGKVAECELRQGRCFGLNPGLQGVQAEYTMVPNADITLAHIPEGVSEDQALLLTDNLPTAWFGLRGADIQPGDTVAVVGCGPIGLMAVEGAFLFGAAKAYAIDLVPERRAQAESLGAIALDASEAKALIEEQTKGRMCDSVVECVGADAAIQLSLQLAKNAGTVSCIGVNQTMDFKFPMALAFMKGLTFRTGTCSVPEHWPDLIPLIQAGKLNPQKTITHHMALSDGAEAYRRFHAREDGVMKVVLRPDG